MHDLAFRHVPVNESAVLRGFAYVMREAYLDGKRTGAAGLAQHTVGVPLAFKAAWRDGWKAGRVEWNVARAFHRLRAEGGA